MPGRQWYSVERVYDRYTNAERYEIYSGVTGEYRMVTRSVVQNGRRMPLWVGDAIRVRARMGNVGHHNYINGLWQASEMKDRQRFVDVMSKFLRTTIVYCDHCQHFRHGAFRSGPDGRSYCDWCWQQYWFECNGCQTVGNLRHRRQCDEHSYCDGCARDNGYEPCARCGSRIWHHEDIGCPRGGCRCKIHHPEFEFPNQGGKVIQDEMFTVSLPGGTISQGGIDEIVYRIRNYYPEAPYSVIATLDHVWQNTGGTFTKRVARSMYKANGYKAPASLLSEIGNIAQMYSSSDAEFTLSLTRNLNLSARDFVYENSCWWGSYAQSRCALKTLHGIGIRAWETYQGISHPVGRAWIMAVDADMHPTPDTMKAHAFFVFNCYGTLGEYTAARVLSFMTGMTYKRIAFGCRPMYVNSEIAYLVAPLDVCNAHRGKNIQVRATYADPHKHEPTATLIYES